MTAFDFDTGGGGSEGPWIGWSARGAQDGSVPARSFFLRDRDTRRAFDGFTRGVVLDIDTMKTGWCYSAGIAGKAPEWKWNQSVSRFAEKPGEDYKKGLQIRCAIGNGEVATWEDSGAGAWNGFVGLVPALSQRQPGKLPLVKMTGVREERYARGSTAIPTLEVVKWVDRPACLAEGGSGIDTGAEEAAAPAPAAPAPAAGSLSSRAAPAAPAAQPADEDVEF